MLPPKLRHILGCLTFKKVCQKKTLPQSNHIFKIQEKSIFLNAIFIEKKIIVSNYVGLDLKPAFGINFGPQEVPKPENLLLHFHAYSGWSTSRGPKMYSESSFFNRFL